MSSNKRPVSSLEPTELPAYSRGDTLDSQDSFGFPDEPISPISRGPSIGNACLNEDDAKAMLLRKEKKVIEMLQVKSNTARLLLSRTRPPWDVEKVVEAWYDEGVCSQLLGNQLQVRDHAVSCLVCGDVENAVVFSLSCDHRICTECLENFLSSKLQPSDGDLPLQPPYTCKQMGCECEGVLDVASADLPLDEACRALIVSSDPALDNGAMPFRKCVCGKLNGPGTGKINLRCDCGEHYCFACGREACGRAASNPRQNPRQRQLCLLAL